MDAYSHTVAFDLAGNVANDAAQIGPQLLQHPVGALELLGVGIALMLDQGELAHPRIRASGSEATQLMRRMASRWTASTTAELLPQRMSPNLHTPTSASSATSAELPLTPGCSHRVQR